MRSPAHIAAEQDAGLTLLFERGLELALQVQADAMAAESAEERARLAAAFHRISRGVRQTAALRAKLAQDAVRAGREGSAEVIRLDAQRVANRRAQVRTTVERLIWTEAETPERADRMRAVLETFLDEDEAHGRLADDEIDAHIARLAAEIGLKAPPPATGQSGEGAPAPDPYRPAAAAAPEWRSSA